MDGPIFITPRWDLNFHVHTNTSNLTIKGMLTHNPTKKFDQPISYAFRLLKNTKHNYTITKHEALAMVYTLHKFQHYCHNLSLVLTTKAKAYKGVGQEWTPKITFHVPKNVGECEGMNLHTPKWTPTLGVGVPMDFWILKEQFQGSNFIRLIFFPYTIAKLLNSRCLKWARMTHLGI
jgi:hypothetical protein